MMFRILFEIFKSSKNNTIRSGGLHHKIGSSSSNQGNIPELYAKSNRSGDKSPPTATIPSGEAVSTAGKYNSLDK